MVATDAIAQPPGFRSLEQYFDGRSLHTLRSAVAAHAAAAGLGRQRVYDVTAAAHELAANTVRHGPGHGRLMLWMDEAFLYCQVSEDAAEARAGRPRLTQSWPAQSWPAQSGPAQSWPAQPMPWQANPGHGLWLIGQLADQLTIDRGPGGVTAVIAFAIS